MELTHFSVGFLGGDGRYDGADQHLGKTARGGENDRAEYKTRIDCIREEKRPKRVHTEPRDRQNRNALYGFRDVEAMGEKRKDQVNGQLGDKIDQYQKPQQGVGYPIETAEGEKQYGRKIAYHGHGDVCRVTGVFEPFVTNAVHDVLSGASAAVDASLEEAAAALSSSVESLGERVGRLGVALPAFNENLFSGIADRTMLEQLTDSCAQQIAIPIAEKLSEIAAFLLVFAAAYLLLCLAFKLLNLVARLPILNEANRILGVAAGVLLGAVYTYLAAQLLSLFLGMLVANSTLPAEVLDGPLFGFLTQGSPQ